MVLAAALKLKAREQPIGCVVVIVLGIGQVAALLAGHETIAYIASIAMVVIAVFLIAGERRWKTKRQGG